MKRSRQDREGAALFVVMMIIMVGTASAVFSATTVSHEVRGTGFARQHLQTRFAARAGLLGALEWFDIFGPSTVRTIMITRSATDGVLFDCDGDSCYPEPALANNRRAYRIYPEHFEQLQERDDGAGGTDPGLLENVPYEAESSFGAASAYTPLVVTDLYDEHIVSRLAPGAAAHGGTKFKYMRTTMTARGRAQLGIVSDVSDPNDHTRERNEAAADMRAYIISGPFITGTQ